MVSVRTEKAARNYSGETARQYEARRTRQVKWQREQEILAQMIATLSAETTVLDCPCGTGRLFPFFAAAGVKVKAVDVSRDMLKEARAKLDTLTDIHEDGEIELREASIFQLPFAPHSFEDSFAIRILNKIGKEDVRAALRELQRVTEDRIVFNLRIPGKEGLRHPVPMEVIEGALQPGWWIADDIEIHEPTFRMITLRKG